MPDALCPHVTLDNTQLLTLAGVLVILFAVILYNNVVAVRARKAEGGAGPGSTSSANSPSAEPVDPLLVKFALHEGNVVGETVALDGDQLIVKQAGVFKAVPRAQAVVKGDEVQLSGTIDWAQAERDGAAWHASHRAAPIDEVSGRLTRSEDVKAPAMASTKDR